MEEDITNKKQFKVTLTDKQLNKAMENEILIHLDELVNKAIEVKYEKEEFKILQEIIKKQKEKIESIYNYLEQFKYDMETGGIDVDYCLKLLEES